MKSSTQYTVAATIAAVLSVLSCELRATSCELLTLKMKWHKFKNVQRPAAFSADNNYENETGILSFEDSQIIARTPDISRWGLSSFSVQSETQLSHNAASWRQH